MGFDIGALGGLRAASSQSATASATTPVTNLSPEMDGGNSSATGPVIDTADEKFILYGSVAVIVASIIALWALGGIAFRGLPKI